MPLEDSFFPFSTDVLMLSTCRVDGPHQWCWWFAPMVRSVIYYEIDI